MSHKVILVVLDGLNYQVAQHCLGYLQALVEQQRAALYLVESELPSLSRPLYECLLTGVRPTDSGIISNQVVRRSHHESIFSLARAQNKVTAAAAYHWVSELYNRAPYDPICDRFTQDTSLNIQHGCFYHWDHYPDEALLLDGEWLRRQHDPDFLLLHPMNIDDAGHQFGLDSAQYRNSARKMDSLLGRYIEQWLNEGYQLLITSDHGMNQDCSHGGTLNEERQVPLYLLGSQFSLLPATVKQTEICGLVCELLGLAHNKPWPEGVLQP
ncbi:alkaline phosphatase family protein [Vibrio metoecus]